MNYATTFFIMCNKNNRKAEAFSKKTMPAAVDDFTATYMALLSTISTKYGRRLPLLAAKYDDALSKSFDSEFMKGLALQWHAALQPLEAAIETRHDAVFRDGKTDDGTAVHELLKELELPRIFNNGELPAVPPATKTTSFTLSPKSRRFLWQYLADLLANAERVRAIAAGEVDEEEDIELDDPNESTSTDNGMDGLAKLAGGLPPSILKKVFGLTNEYKERAEAGDQKMDSLDFTTVLGDIFKKIDSNDMMELVKNVGGQLSGGAGTKGADAKSPAMPDMTAMMKSMGTGVATPAGAGVAEPAPVSVEEGSSQTEGSPVTESRQQRRKAERDAAKALK